MSLSNSLYGVTIIFFFFGKENLSNANLVFSYTISIDLLMKLIAFTVCSVVFQCLYTFFLSYHVKLSKATVIEKKCIYYLFSARSVNVYKVMASLAIQSHTNCSFFLFSLIIHKWINKIPTIYFSDCFILSLTHKCQWSEVPLFTSTTLLIMSFLLFLNAYPFIALVSYPTYIFWILYSSFHRSISSLFTFFFFM